ncbi:hypothetical protein BsWGS_18497 [Bradybaena similaris]
MLATCKWHNQCVCLYLIRVDTHTCYCRDEKNVRLTLEITSFVPLWWLGPGPGGENTTMCWWELGPGGENTINTSPLNMWSEVSRGSVQVSVVKPQKNCISDSAGFLKLDVLGQMAQIQQVTVNIT